MARYGTFNYAEELYGIDQTHPDNLGWGVMVDWLDDNNPTTSENIYMTGFESFRGRRSFLQATGNGFSEMETGSVKITLRNDDGRYDGWNTSSPLYPHVIYGHDLRVFVTYLVNGVEMNVPLFRGIVSDIESNAFGTNPQAILSAEDGWRWLRDYPARVSLHTSIRPDEAIDLVLDAVLWPERWGRDLQLSSDTMPYWWSSSSGNAADSINALVQSFLGYFFVDASGVATFRSRSDVQQTVADFTQENTLKDIKLSQPWAYNRNITRLKVHPRVAAATAVIWSLSGNPPSIAAGGSLILFADYSYNGAASPAQNVITPEATDDWLVNSASGGGGTDLTGDCTVTLTDYGASAKLIITNNSASVGYLTYMQVRGDAIYETDSLDVTYPADTSAITMPREFVMDLTWQQDVNGAQDFAQIIGAYLAEQHAFPSIQVEANPELQFGPELFDIVTLRLERLGINTVSFRVGGIEHRTTSETCQNVVTTFYLEPYIAMAGNAWTWPINDFGVDTIFGW